MENKSLLVCSGSVHKNAVDHTERWRRVEVTIFSSPFLLMDVDLAVPQRLSFNTHGWWSIIIHHQIHRPPPPLLANLFNLISESLSDCQNQRSIKKINKSPAKPLSCKFFPIATFLQELLLMMNPFDYRRQNRKRAAHSEMAVLWKELFVELLPHFI